MIRIRGPLAFASLLLLLVAATPSLRGQDGVFPPPPGPFPAATPTPTPAGPSNPREVTSMTQRDQLVASHYAALRSAYARRDWQAVVAYADLILQLDSGEKGATAQLYRGRAVDELHRAGLPVPTPPPPVALQIKGVPDSIESPETFGSAPAGSTTIPAPVGFGEAAATPAPFGGPPAGGFGQPGATPPPAFGEPAAAPGGFGQPAPGFGQPPSPFGQPASGGFGQPAATPSPFGDPAPAGGFGQPAPGFGAPAGGFGSPDTGAPIGFGAPESAATPAPTPTPAVAATVPPSNDASGGAADWKSWIQPPRLYMVLGGLVVLGGAGYGVVAFRRKSSAPAKKKPAKGSAKASPASPAGRSSAAPAPSPSNPFLSPATPFARNAEAADEAGAAEEEGGDPFDSTMHRPALGMGDDAQEGDDEPVPNAYEEPHRPQGREVLAALNQSSEYDVLQQLGMGGEEVSFDPNRLRRAADAEKDDGTDRADIHDMKTRMESDFAKPTPAAPAAPAAPSRPAPAAAASSSGGTGGIDLSGLDMSDPGLKPAAQAKPGAAAASPSWATAAVPGFDFGNLFGESPAAPTPAGGRPADSTPPNFGGLFGTDPGAPPSRESDRIQGSGGTSGADLFGMNPFGGVRPPSGDSFANPFDQTMAFQPGAPGPGAPAAAGDESHIFGRATEPVGRPAAGPPLASAPTPLPDAPPVGAGRREGDASLSDILFADETMAPGRGASPGVVPGGATDQATVHSALFGGFDATMAPPGFGAPAPAPSFASPVPPADPIAFDRTVALGEATATEPAAPRGAAAAETSAPAGAYDQTIAFAQGKPAFLPPAPPPAPAAASAPDAFVSEFLGGPIAPATPPAAAAPSAGPLGDLPAPPEEMTVAFLAAAGATPPPPPPAPPAAPPRAAAPAPNPAAPGGWAASAAFDLTALDALAPPRPAAPPARPAAPAVDAGLPPRKLSPSDTQPSTYKAPPTVDRRAASADPDATALSSAPSASGQVRFETNNALEVSASDLADIRTADERQAEDARHKQASRSRALLDEQKALAEQAVAAHDWKKAVHYYSIAAALAPDDTGIRQALGRARDERKRTSQGASSSPSSSSPPSFS